MILDNKNNTLAIEVVSLLMDKKAKLSIAESCTGGLIGHKIVSVSGSSNCFDLSIVAYSNSIKEQLLGVKSKTLLEFGAVSQETAREMAQNVRLIANADIGLSVTGIAGPTGGSNSKPLGTVCFGLSAINSIIDSQSLRTTLTSTTLCIPMERNQFREFCANKALEIVKQYLLNCYPVPQN